MLIKTSTFLAFRFLFEFFFNVTSESASLLLLLAWMCRRVQFGAKTVSDNLDPMRRRLLYLRRLQRERKRVSEFLIDEDTDFWPK